MKIAEAFLLGAVQGLTEFLPISSSGHLVVLERFFGIEGNILLLNVLFHLGSLLSLLLLFRKELFLIAKGFFSKDGSFRNLGWAIIDALIPTGIMGVTFERWVEKISLQEMAFFYLLTSLFLFSLKYFKGFKNLWEIGFRDGFFIGLAQGVGVFPGLSRSGVTIFGGTFLGLDLDSAVRFSFLVAIPTIGGAFLLELKDLSLLRSGIGYFPLFVGFVSSFLFSLLAIKILLKGIVQRKLFLFSVYCFLMGVFLLLVKLE
ncbi:MAG: undecaprenyl-diphosphate phosphatase [Synergistetes bacterium]|nr:undecaprenyl-diphosphate phosphatase [Synergistota bacterium]